MLISKQIVYNFRVIENFANTETERLFATGKSRRQPPSNRLEALTGDLAGKWSIRINDRWRVCFRFERGNATDVEVVDYH